VIKSGCVGLGRAADAGRVEGWAGSGGWKDGGGYSSLHQYLVLNSRIVYMVRSRQQTSRQEFSRAQREISERTTSKPLPESTPSVILATLPPLLCSAHITLLRSNCGNMLINCSTCAGLTLFPRCAAGVAGLVEVPE
jgi:hypothetical protein